MNSTTNKNVLDRYLRIPLDQSVTQATYIWIDGSGENVRAKTKSITGLVKTLDGNSTKTLSVLLQKLLIQLTRVTSLSF